MQPPVAFAGIPKRGDTAFVHCYNDPLHASTTPKLARGSLFKSVVKAISYQPEGILYTVQHVTDSTVHTNPIQDFVTMGCGCYATMRRVKHADAVAHAAWALAQSPAPQTAQEDAT